MNAPSSCSHTVVFEDVILTATLMFKKIIFQQFQNNRGIIISYWPLILTPVTFWTNSLKGRLGLCCTRNLSSAWPLLLKYCFVISFGSTVFVSDSQLTYFLFLRWRYTRGTVFLLFQSCVIDVRGEEIGHFRL